MINLFRCCMTKPFTMVLEGFVDSEMCEQDFTDLCCSIRESLDFCICYEKTIAEVRKFREPSPESIDRYKNKFVFYITFPNNCGTKHANKKFIEDNMLRLLKVCLEDDIHIGLESNFDCSNKKSYALIKVAL